MLNRERVSSIRPGAILCLLFAVVFPAEAQERLRILHPIAVEAKEVTGDVICFSCSVTVRGMVQGDIVAFGGEVTLVGTVTGDVVAIGGGIHLAPTAHVRGDAVAIGGHVEANSSARIEGDKASIIWFLWPGQLLPRWQGALAITGCYALFMLVFGAILRRNRLENIGAAFSRQALWAFLTGAVTSVMAIGLLFLSSKFGYRGNWATLILLSALVILFATGLTAIAYWLGKTFWPRSTPLALATGGLLLVVLQLIPLLGTCIASLLFIFAIGSPVLSGFGTRGRVPIASRPPHDPAALSPQS
ncbi:MAG TPA: polymer-forming cytoskeletal protein [Candidatus Dormibacteraeota bacterium]|nr:polymer-forming cytoskeletal protein [Candidatus Dormibacteraeota bacterium]